MKLIVGLGNPGEKYEHNRHNVGALFVDYFARQCVASPEEVQFKMDKYLKSLVFATPEYVFIKPQTYMNKSGEAVAESIRRFAVNPATDLVVVHDDLDIPLGKFKIQLAGPKLHNGLFSIQNKLRTMDFLRIRIGVDMRPLENRMSGEEYVLQDFAPAEKELLPDLFKKIEERFKALPQSNNV